MTAPPRMKRQLSRGPCDISRGAHLRSRRPSPSARRRTRMDMLNASQGETRRGRQARRGQSRPRFTGSRTLSWTSLGPVVGSGRLGGADGRPPPVPSAALPSDCLVSSHPEGERVPCHPWTSEEQASASVAKARTYSWKNLRGNVEMLLGAARTPGRTLPGSARRAQACAERGARLRSPHCPRAFRGGRGILTALVNQSGAEINNLTLSFQ